MQLYIKRNSEEQYLNPRDLGVKLINEENYTQYIHSENLNWRKTHVTQGDIASFDGLSLRYYHASQPETRAPKGCLVMLHGYCGFWGKFHEMAQYYWQAGYEVFFLEQRGHGYSGRQTGDKDMVHVNDYSDYVEDVKIFMDKVVTPIANDLPRILFSHSMGGAVAALFLETHPEYFTAAILSSPMLSIQTGEIPKAAVYLLRAKVKLLHQELQPFPGGKRFDGIPLFSASSTLSEARYNYIFEQRLADTHYHTYMLSNGWGCASFRATAKALRHAGKIQIPILLLTAGNDSFVKMDGCEKFKKKAENVRHIHFEDAKHELFNGNDAIIEKYYGVIFQFTEKIFDNKSRPPF